MKKLLFAVSVADWFGTNPVSVNGPYPTTGVRWLVKLPRCETCPAQMCSGTIGMMARLYSRFAAGLLVVMTSVVGLGAVTLAKPATSAPLAAPAAALCTIRFSVQAASAAVRGLPSLHFRPDLSVKVQVSLFGERFHLVARYGSGAPCLLVVVSIG